MSDAYDVIILGAGAAGLMCAIEAGRRGRRVLVVDHADKVGGKILVSGGGRCNFTNLDAGPDNYFSANPHFAISALRRFTPADFLARVEAHGIPWHEKKLGQLFCDRSARDIVDMLLVDSREAGVTLALGESVKKAWPMATGFGVRTTAGDRTAESLVVATGGLSIPKLGATDLGYRLARQFALPVREPRPALVPFILTGPERAFFDGLAGVAFDAEVECGGVVFRERVLVTHKGLSGPAILQVSSYWSPGEAIRLNLFPGEEAAVWLRDEIRRRPKTRLQTVLAERLPARLARRLCEQRLGDRPLGQMGERGLDAVVSALTDWRITPSGTEGYRKAEVTAGGVDTDALSSKTLEARAVPGLYFIGEVVDVTGWLGGYNFQWAWASGFCAGQFV